MGQVLRVTIGSADHSFKLLSVNERAIKVELNGQTHVLQKEGLSWVNAEEDGLAPQLAEAIGKAVALRYRI